MAIYTKTGDKGTTSLFDGTRIKKTDLRVETYGTFDECCAQVSVAQKVAKNAEVIAITEWIQEKLFQLNAEVATAVNQAKLAAKSDLVAEEDIHRLEGWIDKYTSELPTIHEFILPGKTLSAAELHVARTVCRRGERLLIRLSEHETIRPELLQFINRLSDCLYILARVEDHQAQEEKMIQEIMARYLAAVGKSEGTPNNKCFEILHEVFATCVAKANELGLSVSMAYVDQGGHLLSFFQMPGALLVSNEMAKKKAYTAVAMKSDTHALGALTKPTASFYQLEAMSEGELITFGGGLVFKDTKGEVIGGLGISGGSVQEDTAIAEAGLKKLEGLYHA